MSTPTTTASYRHLTGDGPTLSYLAAGNAARRPVVFLHGLSSQSTSWTQAMEHLGSRWRTFALDLRGHGRSEHTPSRYRLADYCADVDRLLVEIGEPAILVGHSLGAMVAAELAQVGHPLVSAVFLEDPPLYVLHADVFATTSLARGWARETRHAFPIVRDHVRRLQAESADLAAYVQLVGDSPHPAGDKQRDHLYDDAIHARAECLSLMDPDAITSLVEGTTFGTYDPDRLIACPVAVLRADPVLNPAFVPEDEVRLRASSPHAEVIEMRGAAHNIRGERATRGRLLEELDRFLEGAARDGR
jgi:pimeloyl-ACP methyl ester carboxylesterase